MKASSSSKTASASKSGSAAAKTSETKTAPAKLDSREQTQIFEKAMALFHKRDFAHAAPLFAQAAKGPTAALAHTARMHERMCERRTPKDAQTPKTPEELYTLGVALINQGNYADAENYLRAAVQSGNAKADHFHYALGLAAGLRGNLEESARHLERAIEINPANRVTARNDADWHVLARQSPIREILHAAAERSGPV